mmetsp:Transcript_50943/g.164922  ORF Transcript_50943/g.164922 Transcript_50943/m.164922 type:complete len:115 (+) Transcript_50943:1228-1572(+)
MGRNLLRLPLLEGLARKAYRCQALHCRAHAAKREVAPEWRSLRSGVRALALVAGLPVELRRLVWGFWRRTARRCGGACLRQGLPFVDAAGHRRSPWRRSASRPLVQGLGDGMPR